MRPLLAALMLAAPLLSARAAPTVRVETRDPAGSPVADAVAYLVNLDTPVPLHPPAEPVAITQKDQEFSPYVTPVVVGTRVVFPNLDNVRHHVYSVSPAKRFEIPLYIGDAKEEVKFDTEGVVILGCNIHDWMVAYVVVLPTPYFAKTGPAGAAEIFALPAGHYRLTVWHPRAGKVSRDLVVGAAGDLVQVISVTLKPDRRIRRAPDSGGASYR